MQIMIKRNISDELLACAAEYPAVTILGPRQSGKTTLARSTFPSLPYLSMEDPDTRQRALNDPRGLLGVHTDGIILDEIQRVPELISYLQGVIDENRTPGRYILTGSHQPMVHQAVTQSLAGRTAVLELLPFSFNEVLRYKDRRNTAFDLVYRGFYPGVHENNLTPERFYRSYLSTYVERDIRQLIHLKDLTRFDIFIRLIAGRVGQLVNYSSLANDVGVSSTTVKSWVAILKASYILFELPPWFSNIRKRLVKSPKIYFADVGLAAFLLGINNAQQAERDPLRGNLYENLLIMDAVKQELNKGRRPQFYFYRDSNGNEVDLLQLTNGREFAAIEIKSSQTFQPEFLKGLDSFEDVIGKDTEVKRSLWYNGAESFNYKNTEISNPLMRVYTEKG